MYSNKLCLNDRCNSALELLDPFFKKDSKFTAADLSTIVNEVQKDICYEHIAAVFCCYADTDFDSYKMFANRKLLEINNLSLLMLQEKIDDPEVTFQDFLNDLHNIDARNEVQVALVLGFAFHVRKNEVIEYLSEKSLLRSLGNYFHF